ncbi:MAG: hypothetical protein U0X92_06430 [Anaerolineales bacterium]
MYKDTTASLFDSFAALLEYPSSDFGEETQRCLELMRSTNPEAAELCEKFANAIEGYSPQRMQELFTTTFDMQPVCYPYIGFHLYGESYKRGAFMAQLNEAYHGSAIQRNRNCPTIFAILRFIGFDSENRNSEFCQALLSDGVHPALEKMLKVFDLKIH